MICKFILCIENNEYEIVSDHIKNWDEIHYTIERKDYGGIIRTFTSQFNFTGLAYEKLKASYLQTGVYTNAKLRVYGLNNNWEYDLQYETTFDFTTINFDDYTLSLNSIDTSISSLLKAYNTTRYEFQVDELAETKKLIYSRLLFPEKSIYEIVGESLEKSSAQIIHYHTSDKNRLNCYIKNTELYDSGLIEPADEKNEENSYIIYARKDIELNIKYLIDTCSAYSTPGTSWIIGLYKVNTDSTENYIATLHTNSVDIAHEDLGLFTSLTELNNAYPEPSGGQFAYVGTDKNTAVIWFAEYNGQHFSWSTKNKQYEEHFSHITSGTITTTLLQGEKLFISIGPHSENMSFKLNSSNIEVSWNARNEKEEKVDVINPERLAVALLDKIFSNEVVSNVNFSTFDSRLQNTLILAGESIKAYDNAMIYTSFQDFCEWLETVFGYTYYLGDRKKSIFTDKAEVGHYQYTPIKVTGGIAPGDVSVESIYYSEYDNRFYAKCNGLYYMLWNGSEVYNNPITNNAQETTVFKFLDKKNCIYIEKGVVQNFYHSISNYNLEVQQVYFVHRSELFKDEVVKNIENAVDVKYNIEKKLIYNELTIGYDGDKSESSGELEEFNKCITYTTGIKINNNKLALLSKYRADSIGIELLIFERGKERNDSDKEDKIYFVHSKEEFNYYKINRLVSISNCLNDTVFNGEYSPLACINANMGYIGVLANNFSLQYVSSNGKSSVEVDGVKLNNDILIKDRLFTPGELSFTCDDTIPTDWHGLIKVVSGNCIYKGYLKSVDIHYSKPKNVEYKLIIKKIEET